MDADPNHLPRNPLLMQKKSDKKVITVGCEATTPGWIQTDEKGKLSGYDYDVWQEIGKRIGYEIDYKVMEWDSL